MPIEIYRSQVQSLIEAGAQLVEVLNFNKPIGGTTVFIATS